ncbi:hypothetical protein B0H10DRAFT_1965164 [Mycena sp. CBHHK59/15]|nr:hypothetical protein B0H10DRAFT_1965164 [Mycena sp. CBHHK59/15]
MSSRASTPLRGSDDPLSDVYDAMAQSSPLVPPAGEKRSLLEYQTDVPPASSDPAANQRLNRQHLPLYAPESTHGRIQLWTAINSYSHTAMLDNDSENEDDPSIAGVAASTGTINQNVAVATKRYVEKKRLRGEQKTAELDTFLKPSSSSTSSMLTT